MVGLDIEFDTRPVAGHEVLGDLARFMNVGRARIQADRPKGVAQKLNPSARLLGSIMQQVLGLRLHFHVTRIVQQIERIRDRRYGRNKVVADA